MSPLAWTVVAAGTAVAILLVSWFAPRRSVRHVPGPAVALSEERWIRIDRGFDPETVVVTGGVPVKLRFSLSAGESPRDVVIGAKKAHVAVAPGRTVTFDFLHHEFESLEMAMELPAAGDEGRGEARGTIVVAPRAPRRLSPGSGG